MTLPTDASPLDTAWITASGRSGVTGDPSALFPYWSFTKTVIATCALLLTEVGAVSLESRPDGAPYTLKHLLGHTAGLPDYGQLPDYHSAVTAGETPWSRADMLDRALSLGTLFAPGQGWSYSNIGYMFAREMIEVASGKPLADLVTELIFRPLNLRSVILAQTRDDFAKLHWPAAAAYDPGWVYHSCLTGTARDAACLLHALMTGALLSPASLDAMTEALPLGGALPGRPWTQCGYGLGLMSGKVGATGRAIGHSGGGPFCVNAVYHFPDQPDPITVACFTNGTSEGIAEHAATTAARSHQKL
ncbi:serine hydrolase domain-containing protein [Puniceibacterium sediminis]|uniref:CubicO group peptidase, beta-lactamase class C family n=1 Tax=Puniceibacterium sediminis TaxID=1608407 RepID=A0A238Z8E9_9RHOB|nr:serine hydrolase domain-containing protein [Puniceibacterium sediminis]SNR79231.1 CubicO group peptidase, beta-lactamase class C family [Puniceibacterium sediminis]